MKFSTYAEVVTSEHVMMQAYRDGLRKTPGHLLRDVLKETNGRYEVITEIPPRVRDNMIQVADRTRDATLAARAKDPQVRVSLEHLRGYDPDVTRIVYGFALEPEPGDPKFPRFNS